MLVAIPTLNGAFSPHFGRSDGFYLCCVIDSTISQPRVVPRNQRGGCESLPAWLRRLGVDTLLVGGIGEVARRQLADMIIEVSVGHSAEDPAQVVLQFVAGHSDAANPCHTFEHRHHHCRG